MTSPAFLTIPATGMALIWAEKTFAAFGPVIGALCALPGRAKS